MTASIDPSVRDVRGWALAFGAVSALLSSLIYRPVNDFGLGVPGMPSDFLALSLPMGLSVGGAFGLLGAIFVRWVLRMPRRVAALFGVLSVFGMFAATESALWTFGPGQETFLIPYFVASLIGASLLAGPVVWLARMPMPWHRLARAVGWPTIWSVLVALGLLAANSDAALAPYWASPLFFGWQMLFLLGLTWPLDQRPHMPLG